MLNGIVTLMMFQLAGETAALVLRLPVPGSICGMALLLGWLSWCDDRVPADLCKAADGLLANMALLFVPVGVGVMNYWELLGRDWFAIGISLVASTLIAIAVTVRVAEWLTRRATSMTRPTWRCFNVAWLKATTRMFRP